MITAFTIQLNFEDFELIKNNCPYLYHQLSETYVSLRIIATKNLPLILNAEQACIIQEELPELAKKMRKQISPTILLDELYRTFNKILNKLKTETFAV